MAAMAEVKKIMKDRNIELSVACAEAVKKKEFAALNVETLRSRLRYVPKTQQGKSQPRLLTKEQEDFIAKLVVSFSTLPNPLGPGEVRWMAKVTVGMEREPTKEWLTGYLARHQKKIGFRLAKKSHKKSILQSRYPEILEWTKEVSMVLGGVALEASLVLNIDETRALPASKARLVVASKRVSEAQYQMAQDATLYTLVSCVCADGSTLFCVYLFKRAGTAKSLQQSIYTPIRTFKPQTRNNGSYPIYYAVTPGGYMNCEAWNEVLKILVELVGQRQGLGKDKPAALFLDGCSSHRKEDTMTLLKANNILPIYFPSNTSHILQPLDGAPFANYKNRVTSLSRSASLAESIGASQQKMTDLITSIQAHEEAVTPEVVRAGFKKRGIWPWDPEIALANAVSASPTAKVIAAHGDITDQLIADSLVEELKEYFTPKKQLERRGLTSLNSPAQSEHLQIWQRRKSTPAKAIRAKKTTSKLLSKAKERDLTYILEEDESVDLEVHSQTSEGSSSSLHDSPSICVYCGHQRTSGALQSSCGYCEDLWLCFECVVRGVAMQDHMKKHQDEQNRPVRKRPKISFVGY